MSGFSSTCRANVEFAEKTCSPLRYEEIHFGVLRNGRVKLIARDALIPSLQLVLFVYKRLAMKQQSARIVAVT